MLFKIIELFCSNAEKKCELGSQMLFTYCQETNLLNHEYQIIDLVRYIADIIVDNIKIDIPTIFTKEELQTHIGQEYVQTLTSFDFGNIEISIQLAQRYRSQYFDIAYTSAFIINHKNLEPFYRDAEKTLLLNVKNKTFFNFHNEISFERYYSALLVLNDIKCDLLKRLVQLEIHHNMTNLLGNTILYHWIDRYYPNKVLSEFGLWTQSAQDFELHRSKKAFDKDNLGDKV